MRFSTMCPTWPLPRQNRSERIRREGQYNQHMQRHFDFPTAFNDYDKIYVITQPDQLPRIG